MYDGIIPLFSNAVGSYGDFLLSGQGDFKSLLEEWSCSSSFARIAFAVG